MSREIVFLIIAVALFSYALGDYHGDPNRTIVYGDSGFPKNCRAIISSNYNGWAIGNFTAEGALDSINRNCGAHGYSWGD